ncbi:MAG: hypothetical protein ABIO55_17200 [Ginsengibacter sp.]
MPRHFTNSRALSPKDALQWAALTYIVAALASNVMLVQYILIYKGRSRD